MTRALRSRSPEWASAKWRDPGGEPLVDLVYVGDDHRLVDMLAHSSGSLGAELHVEQPSGTGRDRVDLSLDKNRVHLEMKHRGGGAAAIDVPWDGTSHAFANVARAVSALAHAARSSRPIERRLVALSLVDAVDSMLSYAGRTASAYQLGARDNLERGDDASVEPNLKVVFDEADRRLPSWRRDAVHRSRLKVALRAALAGASDGAIDQACVLLGDALGEDVRVIRRGWAADAL